MEHKSKKPSRIFAVLKWLIAPTVPEPLYNFIRLFINAGCIIILTIVFLFLAKAIFRS